MSTAMRLRAMGQRGYLSVIDDRGRWTGIFETDAARLAEPLGWRKPTRVFVNSMSDLFGEGVPFEFIAAVFGVMAATPRHTYQVLTKRPARMVEFFSWWDEESAEREPLPGARLDVALEAAAMHVAGDAWDAALESSGLEATPDFVREPWPLPNVWLGVSVEDQRAADERIPLLLQAPAAVRFLSCEPLLDWLDLGLEGGECPSCSGEAVAPEVISQHERACRYPGHDVLDEGGGRCVGCGAMLPACPDCGPRHGRAAPRAIDWIIVGGESGPGARRCEISGIRSVIKQCAEAGVACFVKQVGAHPTLDGIARGQAHGTFVGDLLARIKDPKGGDPAEWPEDLRVRQWPREVAHAG